MYFLDNVKNYFKNIIYSLLNKCNLPNSHLLGSLEIIDNEFKVLESKIDKTHHILTWNKKILNKEIYLT